MKRVSLNDLAESLGVSKTLVSLVLNDKGDQYGINKEVQLKVKAKALEMNYRPNQMARNLRSGKTNTIGVVVDDLSNGFQSKLLQFIEEKAIKLGYSVVVTTTLNDRFLSSLVNRNVDGIILNTIKKSEELDQMQKNNFPFVSVRGELGKKNFVGLNYEEIIEQNCTYLIDKGHRKIAIAFEDKSAEGLMKEALKGAKKAFVKNGLDLEGITALSIDGRDGSEVSNVLKEVKAINPELNAIISVDDLLTIKLVESLNEMGLSIPSDVSLLSLFDHDVFSFTFPKISANRTPYELMADSILDILIQQINGSKEDGKVVKLISSFVERASA